MRLRGPTISLGEVADLLRLGETIKHRSNQLTQAKRIIRDLETGRDLCLMTRRGKRGHWRVSVAALVELEPPNITTVSRLRSRVDVVASQVETLEKRVDGHTVELRRQERLRLAMAQYLQAVSEADADAAQHPTHANNPPRREM